jgi:hypothetical protein
LPGRRMFMPGRRLRFENTFRIQIAFAVPIVAGAEIHIVTNSPKDWRRVGS